MSERRYELDWIRVIIVLMLIYYHSARVFDLQDFYVKNPSLNMLSEAFVAFASLWAMPLLFLVAGASAFYALRKRDNTAFAIERVKRLAIPYVIGLFLFAAPQIYIVYIQKAGNPHSLISFWKYQFSVAPYTQIIAGKVDDALVTAYTWEAAHLWFILYLLLFSLAMLPVMRSIRDGRLRAPTDKFAELCRRNAWSIFLFIVPTAVAYTAGLFLTENFSRLLLVVPFLYGFIIYSDNRFTEAIDRVYKVAAWTAVVLTPAFFLTIVIGDFEFEAGAARFLWGPWMGIAATLWLIAFIGLGRTFLSRRNAFLDYASDGSYPFYILHQTVIVLLAFLIVKMAVPSAVKYLLLTTSALVITAGAYEVLIKRWAPLRFIFGMRPAQSGSNAAVAPGTASPPGAPLDEQASEATGAPSASIPEDAPSAPDPDISGG